MTGGSEYIGTAGADGRFRFEGFPPGYYELSGRASGYSKIAYGARKPEVRGAILHFDPGEKLSKVELRLARSSSVSGKVLDENGDPVSAVSITVIGQIWFSGHREYRIFKQGSTDDRGVYHMSGLPTGRYYLQAVVQDRSFVTDPGKPEQELLRALYPDSPNIENASAIDLEPAQNLTDVDFHLHTGSVFHVRGRANSDGSESFTVSLKQSGSDWVLPGLDTSLAKDGTFDIARVAPGNYVAEAVSMRGGRVIGAVPVEVKDSDVNGIVIPLAATIQVTGMIHMDSGSGDPAQASVLAQSLEERGAAFISSASATGDFQIQNLKPGLYVLDTRSRNLNDYVASIQYNGEEMLGAPIDFSASGGKLEIFIKKGAGEIGGTIESGDSQTPADSETKPQRAMAAVLISDRPRLDYYGVLFAQADQNGHFSVKGVPPGKYHVLGSDDVDEGLWRNREFLSQISTAKHHE